MYIVCVNSQLFLRKQRDRFEETVKQSEERNVIFDNNKKKEIGADIFGPKCKWKCSRLNGGDNHSRSVMIM